ncbi:MAG: DUF4870 domain-containing protein [Microbacterium sp.]
MTTPESNEAPQTADGQHPAIGSHGFAQQPPAPAQPYPAPAQPYPTYQGQSAPVQPAPPYAGQQPVQQPYPGQAAPAQQYQPYPGQPYQGQPGPYPGQPGPYPGQPGAPYGYPVPVRTPTGTLSWALGFLVFLVFPFISGIISGVAMGLSYGSAAKHGGIARENGRSAANWGFTYVLVSVVLVIAHFVMLAALSGTSAARGFFPIGLPLTVYFVISLLHIVLVIVGTVRASSGKVMKVPFAIPFIRA